MKRQLAVSLLVWIFLTASVQAQSSRSDPQPADSQLVVDIDPSEQRILDALFKPRRVDLFNVALPELVNYLNSIGVPAVLDKRHLDDSGIPLDTRVTLSREPIRLVDALGLAFRDGELDWTISDQTLIITSREYAGERLATRMYDVRNLVEFTPVVLDRSRPLVYEPDFDSLITMITQTIDPDTWSDAGGTGSISPYSTRRMRVLVISQTYRVHLEVESLLQRMGRLGGFAPLDSPAADSRIAANPGTSRLRTSRLKTTQLPAN